MAAWLPNGCPSAGVVTRTSGAGRSGIGLSPSGQLAELLQVHQVVDADEEQPVAAPKVADQRVPHPASVQLVAGDLLGGFADGATRLLEEDDQLVDRCV